MVNKKKYFIAVLIPVLILVLMTVLPLTAMFMGQEILLETMPLDPRDLFRGDHVVLNYKISQVEESKIPDELKNDDSKYFAKNLYAVLKSVGNFYEVERISINKPESGIYLKCRYDYRDEAADQSKFETRVQPQPAVVTSHIYHFSYFLDRYFVPENTGAELEKLSREGKLAAKVKVYGDYVILIEVSENIHNK